MIIATNYKYIKNEYKVAMLFFNLSVGNCNNKMKKIFTFAKLILIFPDFWDII